MGKNLEVLQCGTKIWPIALKGHKGNSRRRGNEVVQIAFDT
jgi:hypothetical protein